MELWTSPTPNGWKTSIMIEELQEAGAALPALTVIPVDLMAGDQFTPAFTAISPNQKIPALVDGDIRLMESCAILHYLAETYPSALLPQGPDRWLVLQWLTWQAANLGPVFGNKLSYTRYMDSVSDTEKTHPLARFSTEAQRLLKVLDTQLAKSPFIAGPVFTIADIACFPWVRAWKWAKIDITGHPNVVRWLQQVEKRPAVQRGVAWGVKTQDSDGWTRETREQYARGGSKIADNNNIARN